MAMQSGVGATGSPLLPQERVSTDRLCRSRSPAQHSAHFAAPLLFGVVPGPSPRALALTLAVHPASFQLCCSLSLTLPYLSLCGPPPLWLCLAQGRLSEEIEKLRQEVDQLKGRGGPFVDGIHSRYWSMGSWICAVRGPRWTPPLPFHQRTA